MLPNFYFDRVVCSLLHYSALFNFCQYTIFFLHFLPTGFNTKNNQQAESVEVESTRFFRPDALAKRFLTNSDTFHLREFENPLKRRCLKSNQIWFFTGELSHLDHQRFTALRSCINYSLRRTRSQPFSESFSPTSGTLL